MALNLKSRTSKDPKKSQATDTKPNRLDNKYIPLRIRQNEVLKKIVKCQAYTDYYEHLDKIVGTGASGSLELIQHITSKNKFVLKKLPNKDKSKREASLQYLACVTQVNNSILKVIEIYYNIDEDEKMCYYLILEYAEGGSLFDKIKNTIEIGTQRFSMAQVSRYTFKIARILRFLHEILGVAHRDLKPENLLFKEGEIILGDFGFAKQFQLLNKYGKMEPYKELNTKSGWSLGTVAPDMFNSYYDERVDFWSLGVCCYCMIALNYPFDTLNQDDINEENVINQIKKGEVNYRSNIWARNPEAFNFVNSLLKTNPEDRMTLNELFDHDFITRYNSNIEHILPPQNIKTNTDNMQTESRHVRTNSDLSNYSQNSVSSDQQSQTIHHVYHYAYNIEPPMSTYGNAGNNTVNPRTKRPTTMPGQFTRYSNTFKYNEPAYTSTSKFDLSDYDERKCQQYINDPKMTRNMLVDRYMDQQRSPDTGGDFFMNNFNMNTEALPFSTNKASNSKGPRFTPESIYNPRKVQQYQPMPINRNRIRANVMPVKNSGSKQSVRMETDHEHI